MKIGVIWKSLKENEKRYPLFWEHLVNFSNAEFKHLYFEEGYPHINRITKIGKLNIVSRKYIFDKCDLIIIAKPVIDDLQMMKKNQILFGWTHAVQNIDFAETAIRKKLTLISWENMHTWKENTRIQHIFSRNNELAGFSSVLHFMALNGLTLGCYGKDVKIAIIGFGSTARGAINALVGLGATDITVFSKRNKFQIDDTIKNIKYGTYKLTEKGVYFNGHKSNEELLKYDLIVNCVLQNPVNPIIFLNESDLKNCQEKKMIIDISCDEGMAFDFAQSTSFNSPLINKENYVYYSVDHTPSYFWNSASYEISGALIPYIKHILKNNTFKGNVTLEKAVDIEKGIIKNNLIIKFQNREKLSPYILK